MVHKRTVGIVPRRVIVVGAVPLVTAAVVGSVLPRVASLVETACCPGVNVLAALQYPAAVTHGYYARGNRNLAGGTDASAVKGSGGDGGGACLDAYDAARRGDVGHRRVCHCPLVFSLEWLRAHLRLQGHHLVDVENYFAGQGHLCQGPVLHGYLADGISLRSIVGIELYLYDTGLIGREYVVLVGQGGIVIFRTALLPPQRLVGGILWIYRRGDGPYLAYVHLHFGDVKVDAFHIHLGIVSDGHQTLRRQSSIHGGGSDHRLSCGDGRDKTVG